MESGGVGGLESRLVGSGGLESGGWGWLESGGGVGGLGSGGWGRGG